jgi:D-glycero-alpha-D-manno-heptose-7-phosphate kinase
VIISKAPVRISFFGGGTDYPSYYNLHGGAVLGTTINKYTYVSVKPLSKFFNHKFRIAYSKTELVSQINEIEHPSIRESLKFLGYGEGLEVNIFADLPAKTGLGSSSSFTVSFLNALYALNGKKVSRQRLATEASLIEQTLIKENVGSQDQFHAAYGGFNIIEFKQTHTHVRPVIISDAHKRAFEDHLMIFYTGLTRFASEVVKEQIVKTENRSNDAYLHRMKEMVFEAEEIMSEDGEIMKKLGNLMHEGWELKKKLSTKISNPAIDKAYTTAISAGAYGGKLCGAGSGGFLALIVPPESQDSVRKALPNLLEVDFKFEDEGSSIIYMKD